MRVIIFERLNKLFEHKHIRYHFEVGDLEIPNIQFVSRKIQISRCYESI